VDPAADPRLQQLTAWLDSHAATYRIALATLRPASADASFRRYFRVDCDAGDRASLIVMDAPPEKETVAPFVRVAGLLRDAGLNAPEVLALDATRGFALLGDLGTTTYLAALLETQRSGDAAAAHALMMDAIDALVRWQQASRAGLLPEYDATLLRRELELFPDWYVARHLQYTLSDRQRAVLERMFETILAANLAQGRVFVHRDYMPRNLMVATPNPGILDFQDAVFGPIAYDVASLIRDAFISWDEARALDWTIRYWERARAARLPVPDDFGRFWRGVEWMGLQRHLKVLGIFARINYRDGKPGYLADTPRFVNYVRDVTRRYDELAPLARLIDELEGVAIRVAATF
jgi:aminoglycoside/choline kinase family phosphotransferase